MRTLLSDFLAAHGARYRVGVIALVFELCHPRVRAEDSVSYKFQSWQEDNERIRVDSHYAMVEKDFGQDTHFKAMGLIDSIAGATPTGEMNKSNPENVPVARMDDVRRACSVDLSHQFKRINLEGNYAVSRESDYLSKGWSLNTLTNFARKNTMLLTGYARTDDTLKEPKLGWTTERDKTGDDYIVGLTQLIDAHSSATLNISYGETKGFLSDPYKIVSTTRLDLDPGFYYTPPENRPSHRDKLSVFLSLNRDFEKTNGAVEATYRYYRDTFGVRSHTINLSWIQDLGSRFVVQPSIRFMHQSAADFYHFDLDSAGVVTTFDPVLGETGTGKAPFYSSDYRLSRMSSLDLGMKVIWKVKGWLWIDVAYDRYRSRGLDDATPQNAYADANILTVGVKLFR